MKEPRCGEALVIVTPFLIGYCGYTVLRVILSASLDTEYLHGDMGVCRDTRSFPQLKEEGKVDSYLSRACSVSTVDSTQDVYHLTTENKLKRQNILPCA